MQRLYKRGPTWWCAFKVRVNGRWKWKRKSTGQRDRRSAEHVASELERAAAAPPDPASNSATLEAALTRMIAETERRGRAVATLDMYRSKAGHLLRLLPPRLAEVEAKAVDTYIEKREEEGAARTSIHKELVTLRKTLKSARRRGEYKLSIDEVMPPWSGESTPGTRHLKSRDDLAKLLAELTADRAAHVAYIVATASDLEASFRARRADIDLRAEVVRVHGTKTATRERTIPIVAFMRELLDFVLSQTPASPGPMFRPWGNVRRDLAAACARAGIEPVTPRDLRRTHSKWLRALGVDPHLIGAMLGHRDGRMVERVYGRLDAGMLAELLRARLARPQNELHAPSGAVLLPCCEPSVYGQLPADALGALVRERVGESALGRCVNG